MLWAAADFAAGGRPSSSGIPLMFPFAGRIRGTSFHFDGKQYALEAGDGLGNAIHGFVIEPAMARDKPAADRVVGTFRPRSTTRRCLSIGRPIFASRPTIAWPARR